MHVYWTSIGTMCTSFVIATVFMAKLLIATQLGFLLVHFQRCEEKNLSGKGVVKATTNLVCADLCASNLECKAWSFNDKTLDCTSFNNVKNIVSMGFKGHVQSNCKLRGITTKEKSLSLPNKAASVLVLEKESDITKLWLFNLSNHELLYNTTLKVNQITALTFLQSQRQVLIATKSGTVTSHRLFLNEDTVLLKKIFCISIAADEKEGLIFGICRKKYERRDLIYKMTLDGKIERSFSIRKLIPHSNIVLQHKSGIIYVNTNHGIQYLSYKLKRKGTVSKWLTYLYAVDPNHGFLYQYINLKIYFSSLPGFKPINLTMLHYTKKGQCHYMYFYGRNLYAIQGRKNVIGIYTVEGYHIINSSYLTIDGLKGRRALILTPFQ